MATVAFDAATRTYPGADEPAVDALDLEIQDGEFLVLVGPSGSGKSTALRMLAGLERVDRGKIRIGSRDVTPLAAKDRDIAMVFQNYALYPHMSVAQNMGFALKIAGVKREEIDRRVREAAQLLDLEPLLKRRPRALSGGQRQRVAMGRAIVRHPQVFLMDEPLSNLDAQLRSQMRVEIKRLQRELGVTTLYVTHDQIEAMTMADLIAVMRAGRLQQLATPAELYAHPANLFVARFCGSPPMNVLEGEIADGVFRHESGELPVPGVPARGPVTLGFRPEHVELAAPGDGFAGEIYVVEPLGNETLVTIRAGDALVNVRAGADFARPVGEACALRPQPQQVHVFDRESGHRYQGGERQWLTDSRAARR